MELYEYLSERVRARLRNQIDTAFCIGPNPQSKNRGGSVQCRSSGLTLAWRERQIGPQRIPQRDGVAPSCYIDCSTEAMLPEPRREARGRIDGVAAFEAHMINDISPVIEGVYEIVEQRGAGWHIISFGQFHDTSIGIFVVDSKRHF